MIKRSLPAFRYIIFLCLIGVSVLVGLLFLVAEIRLIGVDAMRDYGEGHTLWMSQQVTDLASAYKPIDDLPYIIYPYPPLYLIVSKVVSFGLGDLLTAGRSVSLLSSLGLSAVIALLIFGSIPGSYPRLWRLASAASGAALVLSTESVIGWASLMRVDMLGLMLMYGGMAVYILAGKRQSWHFLAILLFVLSAFAKQTLLSAPIACAVFGLFAYPKTTIRVYGVAVVAGLLGLLVCHWLTEGGFLKNIVSYNLNPFSRDVMISQFSDHLRLNMLLKLGLSIAALAALYSRKGIQNLGWKRFISIKSSRTYSRAIIIGSFNAGFAFLLALSIGKMGSIYNFFLAWDVSLCLLSVFYLFRLLATCHITSRKISMRPLVVVTLLVLLFLPGERSVSWVTENFGEQERQEEEMIGLIRSTPGPILSDNLLIIYKAGRNVEVEPATLSFLTRAGGWDERPYLHLFNRQYFRLIVTTPLESAADRYSPAVVLAIKKNYQLDGQIGAYLIYRPKTSQNRIVN